MNRTDVSRITVKRLAEHAVFFSVVAGVAGFFAAACADVVPVPTLQTTGYQFIGHHRIEDAMGRLADDVTALDLLLGHDEVSAEGGTLTADADRAARAVTLIDDMRDAASSVSAPGQTTNHPRLDQEMPRFLLDLAAAREAAAASPPQLAPARALSSTCLRCHRTPR